MKPQKTLFSETDLRGIVTFANETFCEVSGYAKEEILGKPHSIIRHPDMPKELFAMLWKTISHGEIFRAVIKNRTKTGNHYWVRAIIFPVTGDDRVIQKYCAIRHLMTDDLEAEQTFRDQMNSHSAMSSAKSGVA